MAGWAKQLALVRVIRIAAETSGPLLVNVADVKSRCGGPEYQSAAFLALTAPSGHTRASPLPHGLHTRFARFGVLAVLAGLVLTTGAELVLGCGRHQ